VVSQRDPWLNHDKLDIIVKSGALVGLAEVIDLKDYERALVWIEGRFSHVLPPGLYAYWAGFKDVHLEVIDAREVRLQHADLKTKAVAYLLKSDSGFHRWTCFSRLLSRKCPASKNSYIGGAMAVQWRCHGGVPKVCEMQCGRKKDERRIDVSLYVL